MKRVMKFVLRKCGFEIRRIQMSESIAPQPRPIGRERSSDGYDVIWGNTEFAKQYIAEKNPFYDHLMQFAESCQLFQGARYIADVGCGPGALLRAISERCESAQLMGFDFSVDALRFARQYCSVAEFQQHDIYSSLEDRFDLIICTEVIEHLLHPYKAMGNLLAAAPRVLVTVPNGCIDTYGGHINFWSIESWGVFLEPWRADWEFNPQYLPGTNSIVTILNRRG